MRSASRLALVLVAALATGIAAGTAPAQNDRGTIGEPRAEATEIERKIFMNGLRQFSRAWDENDGVGDRFNEHSCRGCHSVPKSGGSGITANTMVFVSNEIADGGGGHVFQRLQRSADGITELPVPASASRRKPPSLFGLGLLDLAELQQPLAPMPGPDRIIGKVGGTPARPGRFGWKARVSDIKTFTATALAQELGLENKQPGRDYQAELAIDEIAAFVTLLAPPPGQREPDERAKMGERIFAEIGCAQCHTPSLKPSEQAEAELGRQPEIRAYTDLLLHDMGAELADGIVEGNAGTADFRTSPLWGISVSGPPYLHDGRARDLAEAIGMHGGEARDTRLRWEGLSPADRDALLSFLQNL